MKLTIYRLSALFRSSWKRPVINASFAILISAGSVFPAASVMAGTGDKAGARPAAPSATSYVQSTPPFSYQDTSVTGTRLLLADNQVSGLIPMSFNFRFFDTVYSNVYVSSNGFVTFLPGQIDGCCSGQPLPSPGNPDGLIAGFWNDLDPSAVTGLTDGIYYQTLGSAGSRVFIVQFKNVPNAGSSAADYNFEIKMFETSNVIEIHYLHTNNNGNAASAGIEDQIASAGNQFFFNSTSIPDNAAVRFTPAGTTAGEVAVTGRVLSADGRGIRNVAVTIIGGRLTQARTVLTSAFGYYQFPDLDAGQTYVISVRSKRFRFDQPVRTINTGEDIADLDFVSSQ